MRDHLVAALADGVGNLRRGVVDQAVGAVSGGKAKVVQQIEQTPDADAVAVVAPGVVAVRLRLAELGRVVAEARAVREPLDVGGDEEREALAARPAVILALDYWKKIVAAVLR